MTFYANQRIIVTGGCGMVGSHLVEALLALGANVTVLDTYDRGQNLIHGAHFKHGDAGHFETCREVFRDAFAVFNLAATVAGVGYNQTHHAEMYERNMRLQSTPMIAAAACDVPHVLQTSSVCVYAPEHNHPALEANGQLGEPHAANAGYAWAKRMGERVALWACEHAMIVRPSNIYGPRDYFDSKAHVIPALIRKALHDDVIVVNGSGDEQREFIYVEDVARGMLATLEYGNWGQTYNLGAPTVTSIKMLVALITAALDVREKPVTYTQSYDPGDLVRWSNSDKAYALPWSPQVSLKEGIARTVTWYREHL